MRTIRRIGLIGKKKGSRGANKGLGHVGFTGGGVMQNVNAVAARLTEPWKPMIVAEVNGFLMKVVKVHGSFQWHAHQGEDELFYCIEGGFRIEQEWAPDAFLQQGDVVTIPAGRRHRPVAEEPSIAILFEKAEVKQYGD